MTGPVDILYVIPRPEIGGAEHQLLMLLEGLDRRRFRPHVACLDGAGSLYEAYARAAASVHVIGRRRSVDLPAMARLVRLMRDVRPRIVHTWLHIANAYGGWAARLAGVPLVVVSHRGLARDPTHGLLTECRKRVLNGLVAQFADRLVTNARAVAERMSGQGFLPSRTAVVYNGLRTQMPSAQARQDARASLALHGGEALLGTIARIDPKKDLETMLRAVALVAARVPAVRLLVLGGGSPDYLRALQDLADALGIRDRVDFLGFRQDAQAVLSLCDVSLLSSVTEGLPNAILESMALGKPVVATAVGGVPELITDGREGYLVPAGSAQAFADRVLDLLGDPTLAAQMGRRGQQRAYDAFAPDAMRRRTEAVYADLLLADPATDPSLAPTAARVAAETELNGAASETGAAQPGSRSDRSLTAASAPAITT